MGPVAAIKSCFSKYATFSGRAARPEFWWFCLFNVICSIVARILDMIAGTTFSMPTPDGGTVSMGYGYIYSLYALAIILPALSVTVRRLHDRDRSGWWYWLLLIPLVGAIWLLVWFCSGGTQGDNRFGPDPKGHSGNPAVATA